MKKLLALVGIAMMVGVVFAGQQYLGPTTALDREFTQYWIDTVSFFPAGGLVRTLTFGGRPLYNMKISLLNAAGDSSGIKIWTNHFGHSFVHHDTLSWTNFHYVIGGGGSAAIVEDTLNLHVPVEWIKYIGVKGGTGDSTPCMKLEGYR